MVSYEGSFTQELECGEEYEIIAICSESPDACSFTVSRGGYEISGYYKDQFGIQTIVVTAYGLSDKFYVEAFQKAGYETGDVDGNSDVNAADLALLKKIIAGLI